VKDKPAHRNSADQPPSSTSFMESLPTLLNIDNEAPPTARPDAALAYIIETRK